MEMFLENLGRKVNHPDRWYRFVHALKDAGTHTLLYCTYFITGLFGLV